MDMKNLYKVRINNLPGFMIYYVLSKNMGDAEKDALKKSKKDGFKSMKVSCIEFISSHENLVNINQ